MPCNPQGYLPCGVVIDASSSAKKHAYIASTDWYVRKQRSDAMAHSRYLAFRDVALMQLMSRGCCNILPYVMTLLRWLLMNRSRVAALNVTVEGTTVQGPSHNLVECLVNSTVEPPSTPQMWKPQWSFIKSDTSTDIHTHALPQIFKHHLVTDWTALESWQNSHGISPQIGINCEQFFSGQVRQACTMLACIHSCMHLQTHICPHIHSMMHTVKV